MIWGEGDLTEERLQNLECVGDSSSYLLGFNEPNYGYQVWTTVEFKSSMCHSLAGPVRRFRWLPEIVARRTPFDLEE